VSVGAARVHVVCACTLACVPQRRDSLHSLTDLAACFQSGSLASVDWGGLDAAVVVDCCSKAGPAADASRQSHSKLPVPDSNISLPALRRWVWDHVARTREAVCAVRQQVRRAHACNTLVCYWAASVESRSQSAQLQTQCLLAHCPSLVRVHNVHTNVLRSWRKRGRALPTLRGCHVRWMTLTAFSPASMPPAALLQRSWPARCIVCIRNKCSIVQLVIWVWDHTQ
jgi:hypothetical protein